MLEEQHQARPGKLLGVRHSRDDVELPRQPQKACRVSRSGCQGRVDVFGEPRMTVREHGDAADDRGRTPRGLEKPVSASSASWNGTAREAFRSALRARSTARARAGLSPRAAHGGGRFGRRAMQPRSWRARGGTTPRLNGRQPGAAQPLRSRASSRSGSSGRTTASMGIYHPDRAPAAERRSLPQLSRSAISLGISREGSAASSQPKRLAPTASMTAALSSVPRHWEQGLARLPLEHGPPTRVDIAP